MTMVKKEVTQDAQSSAPLALSSSRRRRDDDDDDGGPLRRVAFVTVGATAGFRPLLQEVLSGPFIDKLLELGYTQLVIQCGPDSEFVESNFPSEEEEEVEEQQQQEGMDGEEEKKSDEELLLLRERRNSFIRSIAVFNYTSKMKKWMRLAGPGTDKDGKRGQGVIISHGGSGSILDALRVNARLIAVPNPALMNNHQEELVEEMERKGHLVWGKLGSLADAVQRIEKHVPVKWPPPAPADQLFPGGLWDVILALHPEVGDDGQVVDDGRRRLGDPGDMSFCTMFKIYMGICLLGYLAFTKIYGSA